MRQTSLRYDANSNLEFITTGQSPNPAYAHPVTTKYVYDALNRQTEAIENSTAPLAQQRRTVTGFDPVGNIVSITNPRGFTTRFVYDKLDRRTETYENWNQLVILGVPIWFYDNLTVNGYDAASNLRSVTTGYSTNLAANVSTTEFGYDTLYRRTRITEAKDQPEQRTTDMRYDAADNLKAITVGQADRARFPAGAIGDAAFALYNHPETTTYKYDALNRRTEMFENGVIGVAPTANDQRRTTYLHDAADNVLRMTRFSSTTAQSIVTAFAYDALNRRTKIVEAENSQVTYQHGQFVQRRTDMTYDAADNLRL